MGRVISMVSWIETALVFVCGVALWTTVAARGDARSLPQLQRAARSACLCSETAVGTAAKSACWRAFEATASAAGGSGESTACAPISTDVMCFGRECVTMRYNYIGRSSPLTLCRHEDAQAIDRTFNNTYLRTRDANLAADAADRVARSIASGRPVRVAKQTEGCAG